MHEFERVIDDLIPLLRTDVTILVTAQVPVGTCDKVVEKIKKLRPELHFGLVYFPENLRLGNAIELFRYPNLPILGGTDEAACKKIELLFSFMKKDFLKTNLKTAEMTKHALNSFLATTIVFGNELGNICDEVDADAQLVAKALKMEPRIGSKAMISPGMGFSGGTLGRDIQTLRRVGDQKKIGTILLDAIWTANDFQNKKVVKQVKSHLGSLEGRCISVLGLTYKPDTSTLRRSVALEIIQELLQEGAMIKAHDPKADREELKKYTGFTFYNDPYQALLEAEAAVFVTGWKEFQSLDFCKIKRSMVKPYIFDPQGLFQPSVLGELGFTYVGIGRGTG